jgi:hypothetical protein
MAKVWGLNKLVWHIISICLLICTFGFLVGAMNHNHWFDQKYGRTILQGALLHPKGDTDSWDYYSNNLCNEYYGPGVCDEYSNFYSGGVAYVIFDVVGTIIVVLIIGIILLDIFKVEMILKFLSLRISSFLLILVNFLHVLAFIIWAGVVQLRYDNCTFVLPLTTTHPVCGQSGSLIALWTVFYLTIFSVFYFFLTRKIITEEGKERQETLMQ